MTRSPLSPSFPIGNDRCKAIRYDQGVFTGLVQHAGTVASLEPNSFGAALTIDPCGWDHRPAHGDSIAIDGCCLTLAARSHADRWRFDLVHQTLRETTLGGFRPGEPVNLEHSVTPTTLMGGHIVQGHVDGVGDVSTVAANSHEHRVRVMPPRGCMQFIVRRGSIAINGVSLTIAEVGTDWFEVALIPTTLRLTNLGHLRAGSRVNLETDYIAKIVANLLKGDAC